MTPHDWSKVFTTNSDLNRFRLALMAGHSVTEARKISQAESPTEYDLARVCGGSPSAKVLDR